MKILHLMEKITLVLAVLLYGYAILAGLGILSPGLLNLSVAGIQRQADTCLLFSIGLGVLIRASKKA
jgi:hypothetical protein